MRDYTSTHTTYRICDDFKKINFQLRNNENDSFLIQELRGRLGVPGV
jgi:hypothetical protein